jgi:hypothetical protein
VIVDEGEPYRVSKLSIVGVDLEKDSGGKAPAELLFPEPDLLGLAARSSLEMTSSRASGRAAMKLLA